MKKKQHLDFYYFRLKNKARIKKNSIIHHFRENLVLFSYYNTLISVGCVGQNNTSTTKTI